MKLYNGDCLEIMDKLIEEGVKVDAIITDPPYGTIKGLSKNLWHGLSDNTEWDNKLNTKDMFDRCEKLLREKGALILFGQEPFSFDLLLNQNKNIPFSYRCIWLKDHFSNPLYAKKAPVNFYEDILIFFRKYDLYNENPLREYFKKVQEYIGKTLGEINKTLGHRKAEHSFYINSTQFKLCTKEVYRELIEVFKINKMEGFLDFEELNRINQKYTITFNLPQGEKFKPNVFKYKKDYEGLHPTQKPLNLMEDLIKTYTEEGDTVLDFTMGSGSTGVACKNLNRHFIGIELEDKYFNVAKERIEKA